MSNNRLSRFLFLFMVLTYSCGAIGFFLHNKWFINLSGLNLLLSFVFLIFTGIHKGYDFVIPLIFSSLIGFTIEVIGVKTGFVFGEYKYGNALGIKLLEVPLSIGLNWGALLYMSSQLSALFFKKSLHIALITAILMTGLDLLIEQVAPLYDFWYWKDNTIPLQNYFAWFIVSFGLSLPFSLKLSLDFNKYSLRLFLLQWIFFLFLFIVNLV